MLKIKNLFVSIIWRFEHWNRMRNYKSKHAKLKTLVELNRIKRRKDFYEITGWKI